MSSGLANGLGPGADELDAALEELEEVAGAKSIIDIVDEPDGAADFSPRVPALLAPRPAPPPPRPPRPSWVVDAVVPLRSDVPLSPSVAFFVVRARREVPPRDPGPRRGRPVSCEIGTAAAIGTCG